VFPIRDSAICRRFPLMVWLIIAANVLLFLQELRLPAPHLDALLDLFGVVPARYTHPRWAQAQGYPRDWLPLLSHMFLHGGWAHLVGNMWMLKIFGDSIEDRMGPLRFLAFYLLCGGFALLAHLAVERDSLLPVVGASGAIAGVMGGYYVLFPRARVTVLVPVIIVPLLFEVPAVLFLGLWFLAQAWSGMLSITARAFEGGVAWWAHVGGFFAGALVVALFVRRERWQRSDPGYLAPRTAWRGGGWGRG
jgi:membrane associated rhomboid family serine protease